MARWFVIGTSGASMIKQPTPHNPLPPRALLVAHALHFVAVSLRARCQVDQKRLPDLELRSQPLAARFRDTHAHKPWSVTVLQRRALQQAACPGIAEL